MEGLITIDTPFPSLPLRYSNFDIHIIIISSQPKYLPKIADSSNSPSDRIDAGAQPSSIARNTNQQLTRCNKIRQAD